MDDLYLFSVFSVLAKLRWQAEGGSCWVSGVSPLLLCEIMRSTVLDVSTYWWQDLLKPLTVDCRSLLLQPPFPDCRVYCWYYVRSSRAPDVLRSRRVHAGVSQGCEGDHEHRGWHGLGSHARQWIHATMLLLLNVHYVSNMLWMCKLFMKKLSAGLKKHQQLLSYSMHLFQQAFYFLYNMWVTPMNLWQCH